MLRTASEGSNIPVLGGNAAYDSGNQAVKMTSTDKSGGKMSVTFDEPAKTVQGQEITVVSKIAYGREDGKHMDYTITDSNGNELLGSHISIYSGSTAQSLRIGGEEQLNGGLPAGITTKNKDKDGIKNGYSTFTVTLSPDTNTITLKVSNAEDESTFTGKFPEGSSYDLGALNFSTTHTWASRSCYVDDISVTKTTAPSYTISFDVQDTSGEKIDKAAIEVTDAKYGMVSADNITVKVTGDGGERVPDIESDINLKSVYAFGDSIVYGDEAPQESFMQFIADDYAVDLNMMAKNGAMVMPGSNSIISQVNNAPEEAPDFVVFDGYTNDAYGSSDSDEFNSSGSHKDITQCYGEITPEGTEEFDTSGLFFYMHKKTSS